MFKGQSLNTVRRWSLGIAGTLAIVEGLSLSDRWNWLGERPILIVLGVVALLGSILNWPKIWDSPPAGPRKKW